MTIRNETNITHRNCTLRGQTDDRRQYRQTARARERWHDRITHSTVTYTISTHVYLSRLLFPHTAHLVSKIVNSFTAIHYTNWPITNCNLHTSNSPRRRQKQFLRIEPHFNIDNNVQAVICLSKHQLTNSFAYRLHQPITGNTQTSRPLHQTFQLRHALHVQLAQGFFTGTPSLRDHRQDTQLLALSIKHST